MNNSRLKGILKAIKLNESTISAVLGVAVIIIVGILVFRYFRNENQESIISEIATEREVTTESHMVEGGETLWLIADDVYRSGFDWERIAKANNLDSPYVIEPGQELIIPEPSDQPEGQITQEAASTEVEVLENTLANSYTVEKGDNLWNIAVQVYGDGYRWVNIADENNLSNPDIIHPGNVFSLL